MPVSAVRAERYDRDLIRQALKKAFSLLGMNPDNPFENLVFPGNQVFIKPNWVAHRYRASCPQQYDVYTTITHPFVIREVAGFVDKALGGRGKIIIGDNPSIDADFKALMALQQLEDIQDELRTPVSILDLRPLVCDDLGVYGQRDKMVSQSGDPAGEATINLGRESKLYGLNSRLFRGVFNEREETVRAHTGDTQLYSISNSIFQSDVYISVPKLKTHHKVGTTLNLKGLVGTMGTKNYLVHWREGFPAIGGDAYPNFWLWLLDRFRKVKKRGAWCGNDTIWRMVVDLYTVLQKGPKRFFSVVDGVLGGEGNGPFCPEPNHSGVLLAGTDLLETDIVASRLMGFKVEAIRYLDYYFQSKGFDKNKIEFKSDYVSPELLFDNSQHHLAFKPPTRWQQLIGD